MQLYSKETWKPTTLGTAVLIFVHEAWTNTHKVTVKLSGASIWYTIQEHINNLTSKTLLRYKLKQCLLSTYTYDSTSIEVNLGMGKHHIKSIS